MSWLGTLESAPVMALRLTQSPQQTPTETASKVQGNPRDTAGTKGGCGVPVDGEVAAGKRSKGSRAGTAAKAVNDEAATDSGRTAAANGSAAAVSTGAPPSPHQAKGAAPTDEELRKQSLQLNFCPVGRVKTPIKTHAGRPPVQHYGYSVALRTSSREY